MTESRRVMVGLVALTFVLCTAAVAVSVGQNAPDFQLKDQFGKMWKLSDFKGRVLVLVVANKDSGRNMGPWVDNLKSRYNGKAQIRTLMDLHEIFSLARGIAKSKIRKETKEPVMIDFKGPTAKAYEVSGDYPVVVVIDKGGIVRDVEKTKYNQTAFGSVADSVDKVLKARDQ